MTISLQITDNSPKKQNKTISDNDACQTDSCISAGTQIRNAINLSADPCIDFYQFACGNSEINTFVLNNNLIDEELKTIIEKEIDPNEPKAFKLVKQFYKSCLKKEREVNDY